VTALGISLVTFALVFGGGLLGMYLRNILSERHLPEDVKDIIKLSTGLIGTMAALVLGLLIGSAKNTYDTKSTQTRQIAANIILIDLDLERYGASAHDLRKVLRSSVPPIVDRIWNKDASTKATPFAAVREAAEFIKKVQALQPTNDLERALKTQVEGAAGNLAQARLSLFTEAHDAIPAPFLVTLIFWLAIIFTSFGLFVRHSQIAIISIFIAGLSVASAIFLILEMGQPFSGLMRISSETLVHVLAPLAP